MMYRVSCVYVFPLLLIDLVGYILFFPLHMYSKIFKPKIRIKKKILLIRLDHLGDMVLTTPVFHAIKEAKEAEVHVLCRTQNVPIIENNPNVDRIIPFDSPWFSRGKKDSLYKTFQIILFLRKQKYDVSIEFHADPRNILVCWLSGAKIRIGYSIRGLGFLLTHRTPFNQDQHVVFQNLDLLKELKIEVDSPIFTIPISKKAEKKANELFTEYGLKETTTLAIHPGVGEPKRRWDDVQLVKLIESILTNFPTIRIVLLEAKQTKTIKYISSHVQSEKLINFAGKTDLHTLFAILKKVRLLIGLESSSIHIACALGTPVVEIHSQMTSTKEWGVFKNGEIVVNTIQNGKHIDSGIVLNAVSRQLKKIDNL